MKPTHLPHGMLLLWYALTTLHPWFLDSVTGRSQRVLLRHSRPSTTSSSSSLAKGSTRPRLQGSERVLKESKSKSSSSSSSSETKSINVEACLAAQTKRPFTTSYPMTVHYVFELSTRDDMIRMAIEVQKRVHDRLLDILVQSHCQEEVEDDSSDRRIRSLQGASPTPAEFTQVVLGVTMGEVVLLPRSCGNDPSVPCYRMRSSIILFLDADRSDLEETLREQTWRIISSVSLGSNTPSSLVFDIPITITPEPDAGTPPDGNDTPNTDPAETPNRDNSTPTVPESGNGSDGAEQQEKDNDASGSEGEEDNENSTDNSDNSNGNNDEEENDSAKPDTTTPDNEDDTHGSKNDDKDEQTKSDPEISNDDKNNTGNTGGSSGGTSNGQNNQSNGNKSDNNVSTNDRNNVDGISNPKGQGSGDEKGIKGTGIFFVVLLALTGTVAIGFLVHRRQAKDSEDDDPKSNSASQWLWKSTKKTRERFAKVKTIARRSKLRDADEQSEMSPRGNYPRVIHTNDTLETTSTVGFVEGHEIILSESPIPKVNSPAQCSEKSPSPFAILTDLRAQELATMPIISCALDNSIGAWKRSVVPSPDRKTPSTVADRSFFCCSLDFEEDMDHDLPGNPIRRYSCADTVEL